MAMQLISRRQYREYIFPFLLVLFIAICTGCRRLVFPALLFGVYTGTVINKYADHFILRKNILATSACRHCQHRFTSYIPVLSWLLNHGACPYCGYRYSGRYIAIELLSAAAPVIISYLPLSGLNAAIAVVLFYDLLLVSIVDINIYEIPNETELLILFLGLVYVGVHKAEIAGHLFGIFFVDILLLLLLLFTGNCGFGGGDIKLIAAAGFLLGWRNSSTSVFIACILSVVVFALKTVMTRFRHQNKSVDHRIPMGPYLSLGIFSVFLITNINFV